MNKKIDYLTKPIGEPRERHDTHVKKSRVEKYDRKNLYVSKCGMYKFNSLSQLVNYGWKYFWSNRPQDPPSDILQTNVMNISDPDENHY